ncbi:DUF1800 family protein [Brevundimonas sp.]|uniref:DUF1800 family protein n=1 Tax=Brevundimonas sp. TaxID=1871086 RepID=UPI0035638EB7
MGSARTGGYTQADVTKFARALTGWSASAPRDQGMDPAGEPAAGARGRRRWPARRAPISQKYVAHAAFPRRPRVSPPAASAHCR